MVRRCPPQLTCQNLVSLLSVHSLSSQVSVDCPAAPQQSQPMLPEDMLAQATRARELAAAAVSLHDSPLLRG